MAKVWQAARAPTCSGQQERALHVATSLPVRDHLRSRLPPPLPLLLYQSPNNSLLLLLPQTVPQFSQSSRKDPLEIEVKSLV